MTDTCRHHLLYAGVGEDFKMFVRCVSCDTDLTSRIEEISPYYKFNFDVGHWLRIPEKEWEPGDPVYDVETYEAPVFRKCDICKTSWTADTEVCPACDKVIS